MSIGPNPRRRRSGLMIAAGAAVVGLLVSACGSSGSSSSSSSSAADSASPSASASASASGAAAFPVNITTAFGTTTIEAPPEKVAVIGYTEGDTVLALGTVPVSFFEFAFPGEVGGPWATDLLDGQTPALLKGELNVEQVAALQPDLIIGINQALTQEQYDQLSRIAPTLARPAEYTDFGVPPQVQAEMIGQALGQSDEIAALGADVADQVAQAAADNPGFEGKTVSVVWPKEDGSWFARSTTDPRVELMESLGLVQSPEIEALGTDAFFHTVSAENTAGRREERPGGLGDRPERHRRAVLRFGAEPALRHRRDCARACGNDWGSGRFELGRRHHRLTLTAPLVRADHLRPRGSTPRFWDGWDRSQRVQPRGSS